VLEALAAAEAAGRCATEAVPHPAVGEIRLVSSPIRLTEAPLRKPQAPPLLGEDTAEIAAETGSRKQN
jgi:crotonobetainyl-CoA:carnitine CoA-transferase CaiB-like acyl-CoA transferase